MELARAEEALRAAQARAEALLAAADEEFNGIVAASENANADDEHDPEGATIAFERARVAAVRSETRHQLEELAAALQRVLAGTYGTCEECGGEIGADRLAALPTARRCAGCASGQPSAALSPLPAGEPAARSRRGGTRDPR